MLIYLLFVSSVLAEIEWWSCLVTSVGLKWYQAPARPGGFTGKPPMTITSMDILKHGLERDFGGDSDALTT
jgi:hypothetical protein